MAKYSPKTRDELIELVDDESVNLGDIDTSAITDMNQLFRDSKRKNFSGIEKWDTSNVADMSYMFEWICDEIKLPAWYLKQFENDTDKLCMNFTDASAICEQLKVAYIVKIDEDYDICEVFEKYTSRLEAAWELKERYENGDLDDDKDYYAVIGYEPSEITTESLKPLIDMQVEDADWLLRNGIQKAIAFDNTDGASDGGTVGKIFGVYNNRLEIIEQLEKGTIPNEWHNEVEGELQSLGYQLYFDKETFVGKDFLNLLEALRWVKRLSWDESYCWVEAIQDDGQIVRIVKEFWDFNEAKEYENKLPQVEDGNMYVLISNSGGYLAIGGNDED